MNKLRKALALILSLAAILCFPISASALSDEALPTIDYARTGSVDIYKYDLTSAEKDGVWNSSYVSTGVRDEAGVDSILGNTQMSRKKKMILGIILLSIALLVCLYPVISNFTAVKYQSIVQTRYEKAVSNMDDTELQKAKEAALAYNRTLIPGVADNLSFSEEALKSAAENYDNLLNIRGDGIMGYVEIPKIDVNLPIYHGTGDDSLDRGVGHLLGSSLPVGGETSHAVLTAHSGLAGLRLFSDLDKLECGDTFYIHTLDETMAYMVLEINTVLPEDTSKLVILPEHDVCTLVTCTPYGVNTHRLMVRGTRIRNDQAKYVENLKAERNEREGVTQSTWHQEYFKGIGLGVICIAAIGIVFEINRIRPRRRKRGLHEKG